MRRPASRKKARPTPESLVQLLSKVPADPQLAMLVESVANPARYLLELKFDGYRILAYCRGRDVVLMSRRALDWSAEFPAVVMALRGLNLPECVLDGEVCAIDEGGVPRFNLLQNRAAGATIIYAAFDLLWLAGKDLRREKLEARRASLEKLIGHDTTKTVFATSAVEGDPQAILKLACKAGYEGIMAKEQGSRYAAGRSRTWLKIKCNMRQEFAVVGYIPMVGGKVVGALLLAVCEEGRFVIAGRVGTGFTSAQRAELARALDRDGRPMPTAEGAPPDVLAKAIWATPRLVVEVAYLERTRGELRHPSFKGLRKDKAPKDCRWEVADGDA
jgi:bifunctional non-homologous end joining protein LigD